MEISNIGSNVAVNQINSNPAPIERTQNDDNGVKNTAADNNEVKEKKVKPKDLNDAVDVANKVLFKNNTHLKFKIHEKTKDVMVSIVQDDTGEVIKEIPPEKILDMVAKLWEIAGIIIDEKR